MKSDKRLCRKWAFWVKYWPVCKIPTTQVAELKFCTWKFQVKSSCSSWVPEGGPCVFYRPVCKVPNTHGTNFFSPLITFVRQIRLQEQISAKFTKPISQYVILAKFTFWSVKYQPNRWPNWNFAYHLRLSISTTGQNFKIIALVNLEILRGGPRAPLPRCFPY